MPFIAADPQKVAALEDDLSKTMFKNSAQFIEAYNSGFINRRFEETVEYARRISEAYLDVREKNNHILFISEQEIHLEQTLKTLEEWLPLAKIKRTINQLLEDKELTPTESVYFVPNAMGFVTHEDEAGDLVKLNDEKLFTKMDTPMEIYKKYSTRQNRDFAEKEVLEFAVSDFVNIDDSFIGRIYEALPKAISGTEIEQMSRSATIEEKSFRGDPEASGDQENNSAPQEEKTLHGEQENSASPSFENFGGEN